MSSHHLKDSKNFWFLEALEASLKARPINAPLILDYSLRIIQSLSFTLVGSLQPVLWLSQSPTQEGEVKH